MSRKEAKRTKEPKGAIKEKKLKVLNSLQEFGAKIYSQIASGDFPSVKMPSRSINNIFYDQKLRQYVLGNKNVRRSSRNIRHIRPLTQLVWTGMFVDELTRQSKTSTLRDVFYSAQAYEMSFTDQQESDNLITDLETVIGYSREDFNVFPEERSAIFGDLTVEYTLPGYEGRRLNLTSHPDGMMIGPALTSAEFISCKADKVIAIEKGGLFTRFIEENVHKKHKALLIHTAGQAPRATRGFLRRLNQELDLPVYIFSLDGEETVLFEKDGLVRTERIGELIDRLVVESGCNITQSYGCGQKLLLCQRSRVENAIRFPTIRGDGSRSSGEATYVLRHEIDEPLYEIFLHGGFSVKVTGSHSVMLLDDFCLKPRRVSDLRPGDTVAVRWHVPEGKTLTQIRLLDLISSDKPELVSKLWVRSANLHRLITERSRGQRSRRWLSRGAAPLKAVDKLSILGRSDRLRWGRSEFSIPSIIEVSEDLGRLLGYYAAEGCCTTGGVRISFGPGEGDYLNDAARCVENVFQLRPRVYGNVLVFGGRLLSEVFTSIFRAGGEAREKAVPYIILNAPPEVKIEFLRGYFRCGRMIRFSRRDQPTLSARTVSRRLVSDLLILFAQIGVFASVEHKKDGRTRTIPATGQTIHHSDRYYMIRISDRSSLLKLRSIVEDLYGCRLDYLDKPVRKGPPWYSVPKSLVMNARQAIRSACPPSSRPELETFLQHEIYGYKRIPMLRLHRIVSKLNHNEDRRLLFLRNLVKNNVILLPIKKIERVKSSSRFVYDVEVADAHTFIGGLGPVLLHNTDGDPWGMHIAMVIISGSANAAHLRDLNTPDAKWFGVYATDIVEYKLPSDKLTELDIKRLYELKRDPRYEGKLWNREIETFMKIKKKAEQEAFSRYGLTYIVDEYLPAKLEMAGSE